MIGQKCRDEPPSRRPCRYHRPGSERAGNGRRLPSHRSGATTAPLNRAYRQEEFEFTLSDLNAKALVVEAGTTFMLEREALVRAAVAANIALIGWTGGEGK